MKLIWEIIYRKNIFLYKYVGDCSYICIINNSVEKNKNMIINNIFTRKE